MCFIVLCVVCCVDCGVYDVNEKLSMMCVCVCVTCYINVW